MRYVVQSSVLTLAQAESECRRCGARNVQLATRSQQIFCDLEPAAAEALSAVPGIVVKPVGTVRTGQAVRVPPESRARASPNAVTPATIYAASQAAWNSLLYDLRAAYDPPLLGTGFTTCVLDTGVRKTHKALAGKVVYEANFTSSPTADDIFDHGTGVAFLLAGGSHAPGVEAGIAPGASIMNIKVVDDDGVGSEESVVMGLEHVAELRKDAIARGLDIYDPLFPNNCNMSIGTEDTGDPDSPIRRAIRSIVTPGDPEWDVAIVAAAGNDGPEPGTIMEPACDPLVVAVGVVVFSPWDIWPPSSRGPTKEGYVKPDLIFYGADLLTASASGDEAFVVKSGSSFAAPCIMGAGDIFTEAVYRATGVTMMEASQYFQLMPFLCRKPAGAPAEKDNTYGYGMPMGDLALGVTRPTAGLTDMMTTVAGMGMMGMMMAGMAKAMSRR